MPLPLRQTLMIKLSVEKNFALPQLPGEPLALRLCTSTNYGYRKAIDWDGPASRSGIGSKRAKRCGNLRSLGTRPD